MTGHLLGAAGSVEAIITVMSLVGQIVRQPSTYNPEDDLDIDLVLTLLKKYQRMRNL